MSEKLLDRSISDIIHESFIEYAKEVIEERALPDSRDGLKPVQRRILYTMYKSGFTPDKPYRKSAATVGEVLKSFHPHGDASVYNALVKMAQSFNRRYTLIDGHGNFGTVDDNPAAMRYTESRLSQIAMLMLKDIEKDVVDWRNNYDDTDKEPIVLPSMIPNLIINGGSGIAVGVATNIPPHNLNETIDAICAYIDNPNITTKELLLYLKGPDFPTGGIVSPTGLLECYEKGVGTITIRGRIVIEELPKNKKQIVITEIPYRVSKNELLSKIENLVEEEDFVLEIRDESNKNGIRVVIEMGEKSDEKKLLEKLYNKTPLQIKFSYNCVALVNNKPKLLSLKEMISEYVCHRKEVVIRRIRYDLNNAKNKLHIVEGLIKAVQDIDNVINIIRSSKNTTEAKKRLIKEINLTEEQVQAVLKLQLQRLTRLEISSLKKELDTLHKTIKKLEHILSNDKNIENEIKKELLEIRKSIPSKRKTLIKDFDELEIKSRVEEFTLQINDSRKVRKLSPNYRGDRGIILKTDSTKTICLFDEDGYIRKFTGIDIPDIVVSKVLALCNEDEIDEETDIIFVTTDGQIKKSVFKEYIGLSEDSMALKLNEGAKVAAVLIGSGIEEILIITKKSFIIRFNHTNVRQIGRIGIGVKGIRLEDGDIVVGAVLVSPNDKGVLKIETDAGEKEIEINSIPTQKRGGKGTKLFKEDRVIGLLGTK